MTLEIYLAVYLISCCGAYKCVQSHYKDVNKTGLFVEPDSGDVAAIMTPFLNSVMAISWLVCLGNPAKFFKIKKK